jgi:hypothetical protein
MCIGYDTPMQIVGITRRCPVRWLIVAFVKSEEDGQDRFYILPWNRLRDLLVGCHKAFCGGEVDRSLRVAARSCDPSPRPYGRASLGNPCSAS